MDTTELEIIREIANTTRKVSCETVLNLIKEVEKLRLKLYCAKEDLHYYKSECELWALDHVRAF